ncbi:sulfite exporter TauE/SafE family protein [Xanthocytophaga agilis]|uniref:Probable membrane transporter protein n=1 Tax=Xanthocytophaga agilis TaxID=3048010 RepID=A0AAE3RA14_9BACT|nr:sulfite exporter TauE/SafE family protein [Xanthocytophaga agilis]MDJ1504219.1 sulfite exporter TauE/SafE family protein [Xanthocytophaga agilis]
MQITDLFGFLSSILIGISLGLIGGGGSILTLPVLVYLLHINPVLSTSYTLFVVGITSLVGSLNYMRRSLVDYRAAVIFAIPSFLTVWLTRHYLMSLIPDILFEISGFSVSKNLTIMMLFALVMLLASVSMIKGRKTMATEPITLSFNYPLIGLSGVVIGVLTGIVGAGGGFLIIPALVLFAHLPMKMAVGTSLLIIAANSLIGFTSSVASISINWSFLFEFTALSVLGIFVGSYMSRFIAGEKLKRTFGWFILVMGFYILSKELIFR